MSDTKRETVKQWYDGTLYSRLDSMAEDVIVLIMPRLHVDDLAGHVLDKEGWVHLNIPAIAEAGEAHELGPGRVHRRRAGELLHSEREPRQTLEAIKRTLGSYPFSAQYHQSPAPPGGTMIQWSWFRRYREAAPRGPNDMIVQSWDTASKSSELSDYSVGTTWPIRDEDCYLLDVVREGLDYPFLKKRIVAEACRHGANTILIEDKGSGTSLIQDLRHGGVRPIAITPLDDKVTRMAALSARIEASHVPIPERAAWPQDFQSEIPQFPNGRHDDQVDSLSQLLGWLDERSKRTPWRTVKLIGY